MSSIDEAASAVGGNAEQARELANAIVASKDVLDTLIGALSAVGLEGKASQAQAASDRAEELTGQVNGVGDALDALRAQIEALKGLLAAAGGSVTSITSSPSTSSPGPTVTRPRHSPDPSRRPGGTPAAEDGGKTRGLRRENESAEALARAGYDIEQSPPTNVAGKNPDYRIQGELWDCYAPSGSSAKNIRKSLRDKVHDRQASRIVLNLDDCGASPAEIRAVLERDPIRGLEEIKIVRGGVVEQFYPWDSEVG